MSFISFLELGFLKNSENTCTWALDYYSNYYFSIFSTITIVAFTYSVLVVVVSLTSTTSVNPAVKKAEFNHAKNVKMAMHILSHSPLFADLNSGQLDAIAQSMDVLENLDKHRVLKKEGERKGLFVIVLKGECLVEDGGHVVTTLTQGHHFGENALFTNQSAKICVKTKAKDTAVMSLTKAKFNRIKHEGKFVHEDMMAKIEKLQSESEEQIIAHTFSSTDANGNAVIDRAEAEKWLRSRRFDPSDAFMDHVFEKFDKDKSGGISREEFASVLRHADQLEEQFDEFDRDNSATISVKELGHLMKRCGKEELSKKELQKIVKEVDTDGSGEIGFDEFVEMVISRYAGTRLALPPGRALG